ncbi:MAG: ParB/RepB/Spo0J family partition protein, partial [Streptococcus sp.]|nr:ParB/RepB/Spo0J family partition protein [Streptococcus sp.]
MSKNQKGKGLGRGIDALFMNDLDTIDVLEQVQDSEQIQQIAVSEIRPNPYQPRKEFDEEGLAELAESIRQNGVFQPIIVRKSKIKGYELVAGERRLRASKLAEKETIPAIVRDYSEETMIQIAVVENLQRENLKPLDEAMAYRTLMDSLKLKQEEVANRVGKSRSYVANFLRLLTLPQAVQELVQSGELSAGHARTLLGLKDQTRIVPVAKKAVKEALTVRALE